MSKRSRHGNDYAPSTFPFLAVLLCVIGALILLLVINVTNSRASAKKQVESELSEAIEQAKEQSDYLVSISEELNARREQVKRQIELRRSELTRTEDHIKRLEEQLKEAMARLQSLDDPASSKLDPKDKQSRIEQLQAQIELEKQKLAEKIEKRKDQTPAFSIIPYDGANRTTRRPVYLECIDQGVVIQPEGILISMEDLGPPHGPGNPLDAALRVLRNAYQARDADYGITIPPYPLLIVRPEGIHSYALARAAMSGWDDQFGYELIDAQMEMAYPEGIPELKTELTKTLAVAKDRQRALVAALPARYSRNPFATKTQDTWDSIDSESSSGATSSSGARGANSKGAETNKHLTNDANSASSRRWEMIQQLPPGSVISGNPQAAGDLNSLALADRLPNSPADSPGDSHGVLQGDSQGDSFGRSSEQIARQATDGFARGSSEESGSSSAEAQGTQSEGSLMASNSGSRSSANRFSSATSGSSAGSASLGQTAEDAQMESAIKEQAMKDAGAKDPKNSQRSASEQKSSPRSSAQKSSASDSELKPISLTAGKDWATTRMDNKSTPVSRPIRIIVLKDRWLMCREGQDWKYDSEIPLEQGPQAASEELQSAIRDRVESWGLSLPGGYWVPSLTVQAASDAQQSVQRLQRLLEGSGVVIRVQPLTTPSNRK
jgi:hypothetical protein